MGSDYPIVGVDLSMGVKGLFKNDYEFYRLEGNISYNFPVSKGILPKKKPLKWCSQIKEAQRSEANS